MKLRKKKVLPAAAIILVLLIFSAVLFTGKFFIQAKQEMDGMVPYEADLSQIKDGDYKGKASTSMVSAEVLVSVKDQTIVSIEILKHDNGLGKKAENIVNYMINKNSYDVEEISGATMSGKVIKCAVSFALRKGESK